MKRALQLAKLGERKVFPNPMVGAVIIRNGKVIGEGYHHKFGDAHAEVEAINMVKNKDLLKESTLYVSLEPCSHTGKTPPCVDLIIKMGIPKVVIAMIDPYPKVAGQGINRLREAGVSVEVGLLREEAIKLNRFFFVNQTKNRPFISLKWAQSMDGFIDIIRNSNKEKPILFTSPIDQRKVHYERMLHDAILVGFRTALLDNPTLTNRYWSGPNPTRIILDKHLELPHYLNVFTDNKAKTIVLYDEQQTTKTPINSDNIQYISIKYDKNLTHNIATTLFKNNISSILIEGGSSTLQKFIDTNLYDEIMVEVSPITLGNGVVAPKI